MSSITEQEFKEKVKTLKKTDKVAKKASDMQLTDEQLEDISGGYWREWGEGYSGGFWIECPNCGNSKRKRMSSWVDDSEGVDYFYCESCGCPWGVDPYGNIFYN